MREVVALSLIAALSAVALTAVASAPMDPTNALVSGFASYGLSGLMAIALGYAIFGLYKANQDERRAMLSSMEAERKGWLESMEKHFDRLLESTKEAEIARRELTQEMRQYLKEHAEMNKETRDLFLRVERELSK